MSEQEVRDLWDALSEIRGVQSSILVEIASIKSALGERCVERGVRLAALETRVAELQHKIWFFSGAAAVFGALASWFFKK